MLVKLKPNVPLVIICNKIDNKRLINCYDLIIYVRVSLKVYKIKLMLYARLSRFNETKFTFTKLRRKFVNY